jgi:hypothetical protein
MKQLKEFKFETRKRKDQSNPAGAMEADWSRFVKYMEGMGNVLDEFTDAQLKDRFNEWMEEEKIKKWWESDVLTECPLCHGKVVQHPTLHDPKYRQCEKCEQTFAKPSSKEHTQGAKKRSDPSPDESGTSSAAAQSVVVSTPAHTEYPRLSEDNPGLKALSNFINAGSKQPLTPGQLLTQRVTQRAASHNNRAIICSARAGCGKTTTSEEGFKRIRGLPTRITPSPQQQAIWDAMMEGSSAKFMAFTAFGKDIAEEGARRFRESGLDKMGVDSMTTHRMGFRAVRKAFQLKQGDDATNPYVVQDYIAELMGAAPKQLKKDKPTLVSATEDLVSLVKQTLTNPTQPELDRLAWHYDIEMPANGDKQKVFQLVPEVLDKCRNPELRGQVDFDDMVWLPLVHDLPMFKYGFMVVDEAQDLNRARQELVKKAAYKLMIIGDERQAIYGFSGADHESMQRMQRDLERASGASILKLTVTRRCGRAIVEEARRYVPDFEAHETNPDGLVGELRYPTYKDSLGHWCELPEAETYLSKVQPGDRVLCRANAPLISQCFKMIRMGLPTVILGRNIGTGLVKLIDKLKASNIWDLLVKLQQWEEMEDAKERAAPQPSERKLLQIHDKALSIRTLCTSQSDSVDDLKKRISTLWTDNDSTEKVKLSSIHKAKGLEADRVFWLQPPYCGPNRDKLRPHELIQEENLDYVAITRAVKELYHVY